MEKGLVQIGSEQATTIQQVAELVVQLLGKDIPIRYDIKGPQGDRGRIAPCARARAILGWHHKTSFENGVKHRYDWTQK
jgi:nucleoside-diphosphate-sugar epimerase